MSRRPRVHGRRNGRSRCLVRGGRAGDPRTRGAPCRGTRGPRFRDQLTCPEGSRAARQWVARSAIVPSAFALVRSPPSLVTRPVHRAENQRGVHGLMIRRALALPGLEVHGTEAFDFLHEVHAGRVELGLDRVHARRIDFGTDLGALVVGRERLADLPCAVQAVVPATRGAGDPLDSTASLGPPSACHNVAGERAGPHHRDRRQADSDSRVPRPDDRPCFASARSSSRGARSRFGTCSNNRVRAVLPPVPPAERPCPHSCRSRRAAWCDASSGSPVPNP